MLNFVPLLFDNISAELKFHARELLSKCFNNIRPENTRGPLFGLVFVTVCSSHAVKGINHLEKYKYANHFGMK
ncbi:uncharacterized protein Bfra_012348 [Botrytis fragariae]|uniref:Uncharacterized protein n=1 Tax=Botrytis fragariae TaxID=1964551 RepID=A0A8H6AJM0_9HELO|nr:uncharacterized protein Bfra_012348 [Botrytis fragariae]KAF5868438.1 hypothetical protein Bfra_012348 [Botrytis fragariae]